MLRRHEGHRNRRIAAVALAAAVSAPVHAAGKALYEWLEPAPVVAAVRIEENDGGFALARVGRSLRGALQPGTRVAIDRREANRERDEGRDALRMEEGEEYLVLLDRGNADPGGKLPPRHRLVRNVEGARRLPLEGATAFLKAAERLVRLQDSHSEAVIWAGLRDLLSDPNPLLLEAALDQFQKFGRGGPELVPTLRPILDHPRPRLRTLAVDLLGAILERYPGAESPVPDRAATLSELIGVARSDSDPVVRAAATAAVARGAGIEAVKILEEIAASDAEQQVRYEAEKRLFLLRVRAQEPARVEEPR